MEAYQATLNLLKNYHILYYTYTTKASRLIKYVLKHLPVDLSKEEITADLVKQRAFASEVTNLQKRDGTKSTCYLVSTSKSSVENLTKISSVYSLKITIEPYNRRSSIPQCYRHQRFGQSSECYSLPYKCLKCGQFHQTNSCPLPKGNQNPLICANCGGEHATNNRGCPIYKVKLEQSEQRKNPAQGPITSKPVTKQSPH